MVSVVVSMLMVLAMIVIVFVKVNMILLRASTLQ